MNVRQLECTLDVYHLLTSVTLNKTINAVKANVQPIIIPRIQVPVTGSKRRLRVGCGFRSRFLVFMRMAE